VRTYSIQQRAPAQFAGDPVLRDRDERLESLKAVIGKLAHDFNNFLVPLLGYVTLIREEVPEASTANQYAITMESAARKTEGFIENVLLGVRPHRRFNGRDLDFGALVDNAVQKFIDSLPTSAQIHVDKSIASVEMFADEAQWQNAIGQLLSNARFALATGGQLKISLTREQIADDRSAAINVWPGEAVKLVIADSGFGDRKPDGHRCAGVFGRFEEDLAAVQLGDAVGDGESEAGRVGGGARREEGFKGAF
jgi:signal transduction histidine kinase